MPELGAALARPEIGYEAARLVAHVATPSTLADWLDRASERTIRHLREEVDAAELVARWTDARAIVPPSDDAMKDVEDLERRVVTDQISTAAQAPATAGTGTVLGRSPHTVVEGRRRGRLVPDFRKDD